MQRRKLKIRQRDYNRGRFWDYKLGQKDYQLGQGLQIRAKGLQIGAGITNWCRTEVAK